MSILFCSQNRSKGREVRRVPSFDRGTEWWDRPSWTDAILRRWKRHFPDTCRSTQTELLLRHPIWSQRIRDSRRWRIWVATALTTLGTRAYSTRSVLLPSELKHHCEHSSSSIITRDELLRGRIESRIQRQRSFCGQFQRFWPGNPTKWPGQVYCPSACGDSAKANACWVDQLHFACKQIARFQQRIDGVRLFATKQPSRSFIPCRLRRWIRVPGIQACPRFKQIFSCS